jgi:hypothetical protein
MSTIKIGMAEKPLDGASDHWVEHEVKNQRQHNQRVCVLVRLICHAVDMILSTPGCAGGHAGGRPPNAKEREILNEWNQRGLDQPDWSVHKLPFSSILLPSVRFMRS